MQSENYENGRKNVYYQNAYNFKANWLSDVNLIIIKYLSGKKCQKSSIFELHNFFLHDIKSSYFLRISESIEKMTPPKKTLISRTLFLYSSFFMKIKI